MSQSGRSPTLSEAEMRRLFQTKALADTIVKSVLTSTPFIVPIAKTVEKVANRAVDEFCLQGIKKVYTPVVNDEPLIELSPQCKYRPPKLPSASMSHEEQYRSRCPGHRAWCRKHHETLYQKVIIRYPAPILTCLLSVAAPAVVSRSIWAAKWVTIRRNSP